MDSTSGSHNDCNNMYKVLPAKEVCLSRGVPSFNWGSLLSAWSTHVADRGYSVSSSSPLPPAEVKLIQRGPEPQRRSTGRLFQGFVGYHSGAWQDSFLLQKCAGFGQPKSTELTPHCTVRTGCLGSGEETKVGSVH